MLSAAAVLLALPWAPGSADEVDEWALALQEVCAWGQGPTEAPAGEDCVAEAAVLLWLESRLSLYPPARGHGCGPLQVLATTLSNSRLGRVSTPPCAQLRVLQEGVAWGVYVLRLKARYGSWYHRARAYNGHPRFRDSYGRRAVALRDAIRRALEDRET